MRTVIPFGTSPGLEFLPPGALEFSKKFGKAKLEALFECRRSDTGETLLLVIDLKWTAENSFFDSSVSDEPGPPGP